ncbi:hypothetical protein LOK46_29625 [Methylobacterium sp. NMS14P]|uniref:hypothetical protein n=1 Tax=Methylobacterium sp. NMS14P TaxID=2894310 RepID=UPI0023584861|nr:hypothetical protein [Methylobacterium sp. NMS14P]WCS25227.1 hypothetical protein LOK46_29625 [Methylobacterium sp. NMS14P]
MKLRLGVSYPIDAAVAAFDAIAASYPDQEVTLRQLAHVIRRQSRPGTPPGDL